MAPGATKLLAIIAAVVLVLATTIAGQEDDFADHPPVHEGWVAFGDSFSAGIGAGSGSNVPGDVGSGSSCRRTRGSYPVLLNSSPVVMQDVVDHHFTFLACSANEIRDVLDTQIPDWVGTGRVGTTDLATITIGGNDAHFGDVVLHCFYNVPLLCDDRLAKARAAIETLHVGLADVYTKIVRQRLDAGWTTGFLLLVPRKSTNQSVLSLFFPSLHPFCCHKYTDPGWEVYPRFFSIETNECDGRTFGAGRALTQAFRKEINDLVDAVDAKILEAIRITNERVGLEAVRHVDTNPTFDEHRFCEPGSTAIETADTWFFVIFDTDTPPEEGGNPPGSIVPPEECNDLLTKFGLDMSEELGKAIWCAVQEYQMPMAGINPGDDFSSVFGHTFHPKSIGHDGIKKAIEEESKKLSRQRLYPVLIVWKGSVNSFRNFIAGSAIPPHDRVTKRWENTESPLQGYSTWVSARTADRLLDNFPDRIMSVSFEPRLLRANLPPDSLLPTDPIPGGEGDPQAPVEIPSLPRRSSQEEFEHVNETLGEEGHLPGGLFRRQVYTQADLVIQHKVEGGVEDWHLPFISEPPQFVGDAYISYPGYVHRPTAGYDTHVYVVDSGVRRDHEVSISVPGSSLLTLSSPSR